MSKKMLIDATHAEETRVAVVDGNQLVEFDYESKVRKQLKGGIYLAKVTRVEPSLQAAFVNFGGNRHGFLPFSEIHPDYFRIPISDREALIAAQEAELARLSALEAEEEAEEINAEADPDEKDITIVQFDEEADLNVSDDNIEEIEEDDVVEVGGADKPADEEDSDLEEESTPFREDISDEAASENPEQFVGNLRSFDEEKSDEELDAEALQKIQGMPEDGEAGTEIQQEGDNKDRQRRRRFGKGGRNRNNRRHSAMRSEKPDEIVEDGDGEKPFRFNLRHQYKIQEVIKRGQIMLIQVSKEERGNKGAAVSTYISLPGRYCVLMPNSPSGGGVSRKIGNFGDRKRMREILKELTVPKGMSVILRTAGVARTPEEIKRDLDYLTRLWDTIREQTLKSSAPALINEEGNLIKRSIRDLYARDIDDVLVSGEEGFKTARDFMAMLVPSHIKKVKEYKDNRVPLFHRYNVERQISDIGENTVRLKSGGYLVISPTEALVSIDVNSGKATKERHIEETALKTNMEAAEEVARQLRLRDLGGLVVIDFIDMEERRNNRKVENKLRDALSNDRARIQVGRISSFGLLELSRQRLNPSLTEAQFEKCAHCEGTGFIKTLDYAAISAMRALEEEGIKGNVLEVSLNVPNAVAVYILNNKRHMLVDIEARYGFRVHIRVDESLKASAFKIDTIKSQAAPKVVAIESEQIADHEESQDVQDESDVSSIDSEDQEDIKQKRSRRRGRRGGRRQGRSENDIADLEQAPDTSEDGENLAEDKPKEERIKEDKGHPRRHVDNNQRRHRQPKKQEDKKQDDRQSDTVAVSQPVAKQAVKPSNDSRAKNKEPREERPAAEYEKVNEPPKSKKKGWWNRLVD